MHILTKIILCVFVFLVVLSFAVYGTLSPCEMLKKEVGRQARKESGQAMQAMLSDYIYRGIDMLGPIQCLVAVYQAKTKGAEEAMRGL